MAIFDAMRLHLNEQRTPDEILSEFPKKEDSFWLTAFLHRLGEGRPDHGRSTLPQNDPLDYLDNTWVIFALNRGDIPSVVLYGGKAKKEFLQVLFKKTPVKMTFKPYKDAYKLQKKHQGLREFSGFDGIYYVSPVEDGKCTIFYQADEKY